mmetsp:Transcript_1951/g.2190  ORF Transcript_1951/g.2190 Transcript_1951/m.2190 type:complete len:172 (-) Transcript_1951:139-654(-)|eukprot:CAMPEP_0197850930 /NCGR_PEP_ID=MMETSP1438-20131217/16813_1 /TAXON_ID=1461541 /ORGANISM="Pterosperma sp., Strain CCMP1384" /LENGTH=171 /DNA_ID=CAMNT_0043464355 /DNA_START=272 /DNA_END=787 /DNA_ORIENTATION=+
MSGAFEDERRRRSDGNTGMYCLVITLLFFATIGGVVFYARTNALKQRQEVVLTTASNVAQGYNREKEEALLMVKERDIQIERLKEELVSFKDSSAKFEALLSKEGKEKEKIQKLLDKTKSEKDKCCAGRDTLEKFCKNYVDSKIMNAELGIEKPEKSEGKKGKKAAKDDDE